MDTTEKKFFQSGELMDAWNAKFQRAREAAETPTLEFQALQAAPGFADDLGPGELWLCQCACGLARELEARTREEAEAEFVRQHDNWWREFAPHLACQRWNGVKAAPLS